MPSLKRPRILRVIFTLILTTILRAVSLQAEESALTLTTLFAFACDSSTGVCPNGEGPSALLQSADGNFYGTALLGGVGNKASGTIFKLTPNGQLKTLFTFVADETGNFPDGSSPTSLVEGNDDFLYGTASSKNGGEVFKISKTGALHVLNSHVGDAPYSLVLGGDGNFYGCAGISPISETLFRVTPTGTYTLLHTFDNAAEGPGCIGMIAASDGNMYGTTIGAETLLTTLFRMTTAGLFSIVHTFHYFQFPTSAPTQSANGLLYGATSRFEDVTEKGMYQINRSGSVFDEFPLAYHFSGPDVSSMTEASDGNFWGILSDSIVSFAHNGAPSQQVTLNDGTSIPGLLLQASSGKLIVVSNGECCNSGPGEIFTGDAKLAPPKPLFVTPAVSSGTVGSKVMIHGAHFVGTIGVTFNGVSASFQVLNTANILATVPAGATTGSIKVTNAGGTAASAKNFVVE